MKSGNVQIGCTPGLKWLSINQNASLGSIRYKPFVRPYVSLSLALFLSVPSSPFPHVNRYHNIHSQNAPITAKSIYVNFQSDKDKLGNEITYDINALARRALVVERNRSGYVHRLWEKIRVYWAKHCLFAVTNAVHTYIEAEMYVVYIPIRSEGSLWFMKNVVW